jgi:hypothetical protein
MGLFPSIIPTARSEVSSTFADNMRLPVHRWIRFSAGFSGAWAEWLITEAAKQGETRVFDPFVGSGTTLVAAENAGVESCGIDTHPFVSRITRAKLARRSDPDVYLAFVRRVQKSALRRKPDVDRYPLLIRRCYSDPVLAQLDVLRQAVEELGDGSPAAELTWLTLVSILRKTSHANTAQWQYVLP